MRLQSLMSDGDEVVMEANPMVEGGEAAEEAPAAAEEAPATPVEAEAEEAAPTEKAAERMGGSDDGGSVSIAVAPEEAAAPKEEAAAEATVNAGASVAARTKGAQSAFASGDLSASKSAHDANKGAATEKHRGGGDLIKSITFGGLDGIITTFAIVSATAGASSLGLGTVILMGVANLIADAISMGMGDWVSETAEIDFQRMEVARETWEFMNMPEGEIEEMCEIYVAALEEEVNDAKERLAAADEPAAKKLTAAESAQLLPVSQRTVDDMKADSELILSTMAKYPKFFVKHMVVQELEFMAPDNQWWEPPLQGLVTFTAFVVFGFVPLAAYVFLFAVPMHKYALFAISCVMTMMSMFGLGVVKTAMFDCRWWALLKGGLSIMIVGTISASAAFFIGFGIDSLINVVPALQHDSC